MEKTEFLDDALLLPNGRLSADRELTERWGLSTDLSQESDLLRLAMMLDAASPGPWRSVPAAGGYRVVSWSSVIESGLAKQYADYLVAVRTSADELVSMLRNPARRDRKRAQQLAKTFAATAQNVSPDWLFVAPCAEQEFWFMHNSSMMIGAAQLSKADAMLIDAAWTVFPRFFTYLDATPAIVAGRTVARRSPIVVPGYSPTDDATEYAAFADPSNEFHALTGRHGLADRTQVMIEAIAKHVDFRPGQRILDIGCGDASLLARHAPPGVIAIGTVLTEQECIRLSAIADLQRFEFHVASFDDLNAVKGQFDWVIANGSLHFARTMSGAHRAFDAIAAHLAPGGRLWAGELYAKEFRRRRSFGRLEAIRHVRSLYGMSSAYWFARHLLRRRKRAGLVAEAPFQSWWHIAPEEMPAFAARHGLRVDGLWPCREMTGDSFYSLQDRYSCLLSN